MVVVALGFLAAVFLCVYPLSSFDLFWHLANGRIMVNEGRIVAEEALSYTRPGFPFVNHAWLSQVLLFLIYDNFGTSGLMAFKVLVAGATFTLIYLSARRYGGVHSLAIFAVLSTAFATYWRFMVRPHVFSLLLLALTQYILLCWHTGHLRRYWLLGLIPLVMLWDVLHGSLYGILAIGAFATGEQLRLSCVDRHGLRSRDNVWLVACALAAIGVALIGPWGFLGSEFLRDLGPGNFMVSKIADFLPTPLTLGYFPFWVLLALSVPVCGYMLKGRRFSEILILIVFGALAIRYRRAIAPFGIVATPIAVSALRYFDSPLSERVIARIALVASVILIGVVVWFKFPINSHFYALGSGLDPGSYPIGALRFMNANNVSGNAFNEGIFGGYMAFHGEGRKIFLYNHHSVFSDLHEASRNPRVIKDWKIDYALFSNYEQFKNHFPFSHWAAVYWDRAAMLMLKRTPENLQLIERFEILYFSPRYSQKMIRDYAEGPVYPRLMREMADYLTYSHDAEAAELFAELIVAPSGAPDVETRRGLIQLALRANGDCVELRTVRDAVSVQ